MRVRLELFPQALQVTDEGQRRSCVIKETSASGDCTEKELWFIYQLGLPMPEDDDCDAYLLAAFLPAMKQQADITVHGSACAQLLANLVELQYVWNKWCPELYFLVEMEVERVRENKERLAGAVVAFSGGADAQFSAYRHATGKAGYSTQALRAGVLVHGFDIPLADMQGFSGAAQMASEVLAELGLSMLIVRSNLRDLSGVNWRHYCGAALASVMSGLNKYAGAGLIGSGQPYDALIVPWGSHPMIDSLMSTDSFKIIHDGAGFSRAEKLNVLSKWPLGIKNLRVCWVGDEHDKNCGSCEKCVRTRLNLLLAGVANPACFSTPLNKECFKSVALTSEAARSEWRLIRSELIAASIGTQWIPQIDKVIKRSAAPPLHFLFPSESRRRTWAKKMLEKYRK